MSRNVSLGIALLVVVAMAAVEFVLFGWWAPFVAGLAIGALAGRPRVTIPAGAAVGLLAWGGPLVYDQARYGLGPAASSLAAIMGFDHQGVIPVVLTLVVGALLGLTGAWLGAVARSRLPVLQRATSR